MPITSVINPLPIYNLVVQIISWAKAHKDEVISLAKKGGDVYKIVVHLKKNIINKVIISFKIKKNMKIS
mgnify:CR=1 FL=1